MKFFLVFIPIIFFCLTVVSAQDIPRESKPAKDSLRVLKVFRESGLILGYSYNYSKPNPGQFHIGEIGFWNSRFRTGRFPLSRTYYIANETALYPPQKLIGPKIGGFVGVGPLVVGAETTYYTNFNEGTLRFVPYFGIGNILGKITYHYHIRVTNPEFEPIDRMHMNITLQLFRLHQKRIK